MTTLFPRFWHRRFEGRRVIAVAIIATAFLTWVILS